jgi:transcriptional regulator with XRE-family HTH domain
MKCVKGIDRMGSRVAATREKKNMTIERLSETTGIPAIRLRLIENGGRLYSVDDLVRIKRALEVSLDYLIEGREEA